MDDAAITQARILIVDDGRANVDLLTSLLEVSGFTNIVSTTKSSEALSLVAKLDPDLLLLDLQMPPPNGFELLDLLTPWTRGAAPLPVIVLTGDTSRESKRKALSLGASDFLNKPFDTVETLQRIQNLLRVRLLQRELRGQNRLLEQKVTERTRDLDEARLEMIDRLALAAEYRDDTTGQHTQRVGRTAALLAGELGLPAETVENIRRAAPLHDVGKLGVSDTILLKPGKLTPAEYEVMKAHVAIGADILAGSRSPLLQMSEEIALTHHERWDGSGYGQGLRGEAIPLVGRIVAVADVFDALIHDRPYKEAWEPTRAVAEIVRAAGSQFDPHVVEAMLRVQSELLVEEPAELSLVA